MSLLQMLEQAKFPPFWVKEIETIENNLVKYQINDQLNKA
jgi:hypothetical protein